MDEYEVIRIDEMDFGCEGRPDNEGGKVLVKLKSLKDGSIDAIPYLDKELYAKNINEGDVVLLEEKGNSITLNKKEQ